MTATSVHPRYTPMASIGNWTARHGHALVSTAGHLGRHGLATVLTVTAMGLAMALPLALNVLVRNVRDATGDFSESVGLSVYFKPDVPEAKARQLAKTAGERSGVASATLISASEALAEFRAQSGFGAALDSLPDNPLPNVLTIRPAPDAAGPAQLEALRGYLLSWPEVDSVQLDRDWVLRFSAMLALLRQVVLITAVLLGAGVIAVVGNTIRLEILNRRDQIEVTKLVGGTNAFVRRPFLYAGVLYGLLAGLIAWGLVAIARASLAPAALRLASAYGSAFTLRGPNLSELGVLLLTGMVLGWLGAWIAAWRQLVRIEPRTA
jgi:cell division transport system permease protein